MLNKFMNAKHPDGTTYSQTDVLFTATSVVAAGSDTTAVATASLFAQLTGHPDVYEKLQREASLPLSLSCVWRTKNSYWLIPQIDEAFEDGTLSTPVAYSKAAQLPFLQACIKESLRLHPPISMELPRLVPPEGMLLCGKFVPGGTSVGVSPYIVHRQKDAYGQDAESFRPERWIEAERAEKEGDDGGELRRRLERFYFVFGGSTTSCIVSQQTGSLTRRAPT
jgi:cytochrome P450